MSTYSPILRTELIAAGDQSGTWGTTTNNNYQYIFESAIAGYQAVTVSPVSNNQVLTYVNGPSASPALNQSIYAVLKLNAGTVGANFSIYTPPVSKTYTIWNNTLYTATFYNSSVIGNTTAAGAGVTIPAGVKVFIWSDGTNFYSIDSALGNLSVGGNLTVGGTLAVTGAATFTSSIAAASATLTSPLPVLSGGTGVTVSTGTGSNVLNDTPTIISPSLTGTPIAPTATAGTSTTQIATTAFVQNVAGALGTMSSQNANNVNITGGTITGSYGLTAANATNAVNATNATTAATATNATQFQGKTKLGLGITGETWNGASFSIGPTYTNSYAYPIMVSTSILGSSSGGYATYVVVGGVQITYANYSGATGTWVWPVSFIVPPGVSYSFSGRGVDGGAILY